MRLGRDPDPEEIAKLARIPSEKIQNLQLLTQQVSSLDLTAGSSDGASWLEKIEDGRSPSPYRRIETLDCAMHVRDLLKRLSNRDQRIIKLRFGIDCDRPHSLGEIASSVHISRERVRQIVLSILKKMNDWTKRPSPVGLRSGVRSPVLRSADTPGPE